MYYYEIADITFMVNSLKKSEWSFQHSEVCRHTKLQNSIFR